ncbi:MAG: hypothetical protein ACRDZX_11855 [Acidimicrobiales bacterium]
MSAGDIPVPETPPELPPACAAVDADLVELALGALAGKVRVAAVAHLEGCDRCSSEVGQLSAAADQLLNLAPSAEPPVGFEARVFERLGLRAPPSGESLAKPSSRPLRRPWAQRQAPPEPGAAGRGWLVGPVRRAAAVAAAVVLIFAGGALAGRSLTGSPGPQEAAAGAGSVATSALVNRGRTVGRVFLYAGNPTWLFMYLDAPGGAAWQGTLRCEVTLDGGPALVLGHFWLTGGQGAWGASVSQPAGRLRQARVLNRGGRVLAVADLPS